MKYCESSYFLHAVVELTNIWALGIGHSLSYKQSAKTEGMEMSNLVEGAMIPYMEKGIRVFDRWK